MTNNPSDLVAVRTAIMPMIGVTNAAEIGIMGDGAHERTGGYHEGKDVLAAIGALTSDYSVADYARDKLGLTLSASAIDITLAWGAAQGGRAAAIRFTNLMVADFRAGAQGTQCIRAMNFSPDGTKKQRIDRHNGYVITSSSDNVTIHTHVELFRDTEGTRTSAFLTLVKKNILIAQGKAPGMDETERKADNADRWGNAAITGAQPAKFLGSDGKEYSTDNVLHIKLDKLIAQTAAIRVTLTDAQIDALAQQIIAGMPEGGATPTEVDSIVRNVFHSVPGPAA